MRWPQIEIHVGPEACSNPNRARTAVVPPSMGWRSSQGWTCARSLGWLGIRMGSDQREASDELSIIEYSRSRRIGGSPSVGRNRENRVRRVGKLLAPQTAARAVTTSGQLSLGSLDDAVGGKTF